jgi:NAD(P)-dependent dehydrogenase (short-subunit alcohol dehydrogenase family)
MSIDPVAIITGAGSGVGRETARQLAARGYRLALAGRRRAALEETAAKLGLGDHAAPTERVLIQPTDVGDLSQCDALVDRTIERFGRIDVLINNAGMVELAPLAEATTKLMVRTFAVNTWGPIQLIARCWPHFIAQGSGCVINVTTMGTADPFPGLSVYAAAKSALESIGRSIMNERGNADITAYAVAPGAIETPMLRRLFTKRDLPRSKTLAAQDVAAVIAACACGERKGDAGGVIRLPSP